MRTRSGQWANGTARPAAMSAALPARLTRPAPHLGGTAHGDVNDRLWTGR